MDYTAACELLQLQQEPQIGRPASRRSGRRTRLGVVQSILDAKNAQIIGPQVGEQVRILSAETTH